MPNPLKNFEMSPTAWLTSMTAYRKWKRAKEKKRKREKQKKGLCLAFT